MDRILHHISCTPSTQEEARRLLKEGLAKPGDAIVAEEQTAGRGRFGRTWISPKGGLYVTMIMCSEPALSLKAGLAIVHVLERAGVPAGLKWPNDVLVEDRKIAGVLIEASEGLSLVGIGLNLSCAPLRTATHLSRYAPCADRDVWIQEIMRELTALSDRDVDWGAYKSACRTLGRYVRIQGVGDEPPVEGIATDVDTFGRLIVMTSQGRRMISSGDCLHLRMQANRY